MITEPLAVRMMANGEWDGHGLEADRRLDLSPRRVARQTTTVVGQLDRMNPPMKTNTSHNIVSCRKVKQDLSLLAGRDLTDRERIETVRRHMAVCPHCRAKYRGLRNGVKALAANSTAGSDSDALDGGTWVESGRSLWPEVSERLPTRPSTQSEASNRWTARNWPPLIAMVAACGVMAVVLFGPNGAGDQGVAVQTDPAQLVAPEPQPRPIVNDQAIPAESPGLFRLKLPNAD